MGDQYQLTNVGRTATDELVWKVARPDDVLVGFIVRQQTEGTDWQAERDHLRELAVALDLEFDLSDLRFPDTIANRNLKPVLSKCKEDRQRLGYALESMRLEMGELTAQLRSLLDIEPNGTDDQCCWACCSRWSGSSPSIWSGGSGLAIRSTTATGST